VEGRWRNLDPAPGEAEVNALTQWRARWFCER
jgi:hypothetical protein